MFTVVWLHTCILTVLHYWSMLLLTAAIVVWVFFGFLAWSLSTGISQFVVCIFIVFISSFLPVVRYKGHLECNLPVLK